VASDESKLGIRPSLLDRLIDPESDGTSWRRGYGVEQMINTVRRDLEDLLNSHQSAGDLAAEFREVENSVVTFGLPDLVSIRTSISDARTRVCAAIADTIARFEPRLANVRVTPDPTVDPKLLKLEFQIHATLNMDPSPEVAFVTVLKLSTGETSIKQVDG
jgi:type VI secretion system protein ImpF